MKSERSVLKLLFLCLLGIIAFATLSCSQLAGTTLTFDESGNPTLTPPTGPIQILPTK